MTTRNSEPTPLSDEILDSLRELDPTGHFLRDMVQVFHQDMARNLLEAEQACRENDADSFHRACHAIKNAADCIGAQCLRQYAHALMEQGDAASLQRQLHRLRQLYQEATAALTHLPEHPPTSSR